MALVGGKGQGMNLENRAKHGVQSAAAAYTGVPTHRPSEKGVMSGTGRNDQVMRQGEDNQELVEARVSSCWEALGESPASILTCQWVLSFPSHFGI